MPYVYDHFHPAVLDEGARWGEGDGFGLGIWSRTRGISLGARGVLWWVTCRRCDAPMPTNTFLHLSRPHAPQHVPSEIIIDASMPVVIRDSGMMWNKDDELEDTKCLIHDRSYATIYQEMINYVKTCRSFGRCGRSIAGGMSHSCAFTF